MTWEEAVEKLRNDDDLVHVSKEAYLSRDLLWNINQFQNSKEFKATMSLLNKYMGPEGSLLDIGAGNGISSISFAQSGFDVVALEPDKSSTVGNGAIFWLKNNLQLDNLTIIDAFGESLPFDDNSFAVVYGRQVMHHAHDLEKFISEAFRVLKPGGVLLTVRDHVVNNEKQKQIFLKAHPLHLYYGGENAFSQKEYEGAMELAGFKIMERIRPSESPINYEPWSQDRLKKSFPILGKFQPIRWLLWKLLMLRLDKLPGRLYTFVAVKL